jgi:hypothetical protein
MFIRQVLERAEIEIKVMTIRGTKMPLQKLLSIISTLYSKKVCNDIELNLWTSFDVVLCRFMKMKWTTEMESHAKNSVFSSSYKILIDLHLVSKFTILGGLDVLSGDKLIGLLLWLGSQQFSLYFLLSVWRPEHPLLLFRG